MLEVETPSLVERERELAAIDAQIGEAVHGRGRLVLIDGPAGIGKSQLLAEARGRAAGSMTVLAARASELEREFPFGIVRQLFEALVAEPGRGERLLVGAAEPAGAVFGAPADPAANGDTGGASFASLHGLFWLALNLAEERPLLLAIDDLQWCDRPSLRFVAYLNSRLEGLPVLVVATQRTTDPGTDPALLGEIVHDPLTEPLRPAPLSQAGVRSLVRGRLGEQAEESFCAVCHDATGGNPLLLRQLLRALEADGVQPTGANAQTVRDIGPRAASRVILLRLARLPADAIAVARAVAVLGDGAELPAVAALAGIDERRVAAATGDLARSEILRPDPPLGFVHPLVRDAVYQELAPGERGLQHARAAQLLSEAGAAPDVVAAQLLNTPPRGEAWVAELLWDAGRAAKRRGATDNAVAYLRRALEEPPPSERRPSLLLELGLAEGMVSRTAGAVHLRGAYETLEDPVARALAARELARLLMFSAAPGEALELAREASAGLPPELTDERLALEAVEQMSVFFAAAEPETLERLDPRRPGLEGGLGGRMLQAMTAYFWTVACQPAADCAEIALAALEDGLLLEYDDLFFTMGAINALVVADRPEAMEVWEKVQAVAHRRGSLFTLLGIHLWFAFARLRRGDLAEAEVLLRQALDENETWGMEAGMSRAYTFAFLGRTLLEKEGAAAAQRLLQAAPPPEGRSDAANYLRGTLAELLLAQGRDEDALAMADDWRHHTAHTHNPAWAPWRSAKARALDRLGRAKEAIALAEEELELARRFGAPATLGHTLRVLGTLRREEGIEQLEEAVELLATSPAKLEHAKALAGLGSALRRDRRPSEAREPLRRALELASVCGAAPLAEHTRAELHAAGARPRAEALSGVASLTPSELRVAQLAAEGGSNKEIAQSLYVTPKTVEVHLSNAYRKLGIRSRRELPGAMQAA